MQAENILLKIDFYPKLFPGKIGIVRIYFTNSIIRKMQYRNIGQFLHNIGGRHVKTDYC